MEPQPLTNLPAECGFKMMNIFLFLFFCLSWVFSGLFVCFISFFFPIGHGVPAFPRPTPWKWNALS